MKQNINMDEVYKVINGEHKDPYSVLGIHPIVQNGKNVQGFVIRAFIPNASEINIIDLTKNIK
jgi:1,4-alpha-glucan branching enzyme